MTQEEILQAFEERLQSAKYSCRHAAAEKFFISEIRLLWKYITMGVEQSELKPDSSSAV